MSDALAAKLAEAPEDVRAMIERILDGEVIELDAETTISTRGVTIGAHIGIPLEYAQALSATVGLEYGDDEQKRKAAVAMAEIAEFIAAEARKVAEG
jgi:hypothetical protein